jgi:hypothetical protein
LPDGGKPASVVVSRNIAVDPDQGISNWTDALIKQTTVTGVRPDGTRLVRAMPLDWGARMIPAALDAIVASVRTVPPATAPWYRGQ